MTDMNAAGMVYEVDLLLYSRENRKHDEISQYNQLLQMTLVYKSKNIFTQLIPKPFYKFLKVETRLWFTRPSFCPKLI